MKLKDLFKKKSGTISKTEMTLKIDKKQLEKLTGGTVTEPIIEYKKDSGGGGTVTRNEL